MTEANAVTTVVESLALSRPGIGFSLRSEGRGVLALPSAADLRERISQVHGLELARCLVALDDPVAWGFVSPISASFPTRRYTHQQYRHNEYRALHIPTSGSPNLNRCQQRW